jgi:FKBP-type peptidyl-prolyl cis-trans isomerase
MTAIRVLVAALATLGALPRPASAAPPPEFAEVTKALERADLKYRVTGDDADTAVLDFETDQYRDLSGDRSVRIILNVFATDHRPWVVARAFNLYSLFDCRHPESARRVLMGAHEKLGVWASFDYDESDGTVTARFGWPMPSGDADLRLMEGMLRRLVDGIDELDPVLRRAMDSGMVDWPSDDLGPKVPTHWLDAKGPDGKDIRVGWAVWAERTVWASTLISAAPLLREFCSWDDEQRDRFGRILADEFGDSMARSVFVDWLRGSKYIEQHYPPVAIRFFAPPGTVVSATTRCQRFAVAAATDTKTVDEMGHIDVEPMLNWDDQALRGVDIPAKAVFQVEVSCGEARDTAEATVEIQPVGVTELGLPATIPVAIYVNESHPWVRDIVAEAGRMRIADSLGCSEDTDYASAIRQIYAVWRALRARDVKYVSINNADARTDGSQAIREFHESIRDEGANCADGTAAIASILAALDFDVHLFQLPGHVLVGVYLENSGCDRHWIYLETTALGEDSAAPGETYLDEFEQVLPERLRDAEWNCFEAACEDGEEQVSAANQSDSLLVASLKTLRDRGLRCIPVSRREVGPISALPDQAPLAERRARAQAEEDRRYGHFVSWLKSLPNASPTPYKDADAVARDIERVGTDHQAMGRLLRSVDGDGVGQRSLRALAVLRDAIAPMNEAAAKAFGDSSPSAGALLGLPAAGVRVELEAANEGRTRARVIDSEGDEAILLLLRTDGDGCFIEGDFIEYAHEELSTDAARLAWSFRDGALDDRDGFRRIGDQMAARVAAGNFKDRDEMMDELQKAMYERYRRPKLDSLPAETEPGIVERAAGAGPAAAEGDLVEIHYSCRLADGTPIFDSRAGKGETRRRRAGTGTAPPGFGRALVGMRAGSKRMVTVPPEDGFGDKGMPKLQIPPGATLIYEIEAVSVTKATN